MQSVQSPQVSRVSQVTTAGTVKRCLLSAAAVLALTPVAGCVAQALCAIPCALEDATALVARKVPLDESKYIVHAPIRPAMETALAQAPKPSPDPAKAAAPPASSPKVNPLPDKAPQPAAAPTISTATAFAGVPQV